MKKPSENSLRPNWLTIEDFQFICFNLAKELLEFSEPIPDYSKKDDSLLESALSAPRNSYEFKNSSLAEQTAVLFYSLIKNHPFSNGNKRIAVISVLVFLILNDKWLNILPVKLYEAAVLVANSSPQERELVVNEIAKIFEEFIVTNKKKVPRN